MPEERREDCTSNKDPDEEPRDNASSIFSFLDTPVEDHNFDSSFDPHHGQPDTELIDLVRQLESER